MRRVMLIIEPVNYGQAKLVVRVWDDYGDDAGPVVVTEDLIAYRDLLGTPMDVPALLRYAVGLCD